ncbi:MAG TPA: VanZ family protein [Planctomycetota bacterium]|nr:VanZ family protein [Planctomycetota bacterium]
MLDEPRGATARLRLIGHPATGWWSALAIYSTFIYFQSSGPVPIEEGWDIPGWDKLLHVVAYAAWAALALFALHTSEWPRSLRWQASLSTLLAVAYGVSDEFHQSFVPSRSADLADLAADAVGAGIGATLSVLVLGRPAPKSQPCGVGDLDGSRGGRAGDGGAKVRESAE